MDNYYGWNKKNKLWYVIYLVFAAHLPESRRLYIAKVLRNKLAKHVCNIQKTTNIEKNAHFNPSVSVGGGHHWALHVRLMVQ